MSDPIRDTLADLRRRGLYRRLRALGSAAGPRVHLDGREVLCFASNNYLDLAGETRVADALRRGIDRWGWGAAASRLLAGHTDAHAALEADLADFLGAEAALVFPTGYMTNLGALTALAGRGDCIVMDRACHASLYDAAAMSRARLVRYPPCDAAAAAELLAADSQDKRGGSPYPPPGKSEDEPRGKGKAPPPARTLLVTDAVFSMDGRRAPLADLADAAARTGTALLLDEAHAIGVLGDGGAGLTEEVFGTRGDAPSGVPCHPEQAERAEGSRRAEKVPDTFLRVGTLSKALGGVGGFVAASREVIDLLVNRARPFIYTTALPAAACEAAREALRILRTEPDRRTRLHALARTLRTRLRDEDFDLGTADGAESDDDTPPTPIVPVLFGEPERALAAAAALLERGIFCPAVRPPTVPAGTSRLRISLTAGHSEDDVERLVAALAAARDI
jgi:7-keto-8-aminopelargonate synthetase-like enzyme